MSDFVQGIVQKITEKQTAKGGTMYNVCINCNDSGEDEWHGHGFDKPIFFEGDEVSYDIEMNGKFVNIVADTVEVVAEGEPPQQKRGRGNGNSNRSSSGRSGGRGNSGGNGRGGQSRGQRTPARGGRGQGDTSNRRGNSSGGGQRGSTGRSNTGDGGSGRKLSKDDYWANKEARDLEKDEYFKQKDELIQRQAVQNTAIATVRVAIEAGAVTLPAKKGDKYDALLALIDEEAERLYAKNNDATEGQYDGSDGDDDGYDDDGDVPE